MKAHIAATPRLVLGWALPEADRAVLETACRKEGLTLRMVEPGETGMTVGHLCGSRVDRAAAPLPATATPAAVFSGIDRAALDRLLDDLRAGGVVIPLKAMVTAHNQGWPFTRLLEELAQEHAAVHAAREDT